MKSMKNTNDTNDTKNIKNTKNIKTTKKFFIEVVCAETGEKHVSEFNESKIFNSIEACQTFFNDNFFINTESFTINSWETERCVFCEKTSCVSCISCVNNLDSDTNQQRTVQLQNGVTLYFPCKTKNLNWWFDIDSENNPELENLKQAFDRFYPHFGGKLGLIRQPDALFDLFDKLKHSFRPEAVLRMYAIKGGFSGLNNSNKDSENDSENNSKNNNNFSCVYFGNPKDVCDVDDVGDENQKSAIEHRLFTESKKGVEISETKPHYDLEWFVKPLVEWEEFKTRVTIKDVLDKNLVRNITIPAIINGKPVKSIGKWAFASCANLTNIVVPNSVTSIGGHAFYNCGELKTVILSKRLSFIEEYSFYGCTKLINITIPGSVTSIEPWAFQNCESLEEIVIPDSVTSIGSGAFYNCINLNNVVVPNSITVIVNSVFSGCTHLETIIIPDSVFSIGSWAFHNCKSLEKIVIPDSVTSIGKKAFKGCTKLKKIIFPKSILVIGNEMFENCVKLKSVVVNAVIPPSLETNIFVNNAQGRKIFVPKKSLDNYKQVWVKYKDDIFPIE